jgi:hypothetical protein
MQTDGDTEYRRVEGSTQTRKEHNLNQQQDYDLGHKLNKANSKTKICKGYGAENPRTGKISMALDYGTNVKHSNEGINVNLMVYLSSDYHLM